MNNYQSIRNEQKARTIGTIFAIGIHVVLALFLYYQMADNQADKPEKEAKEKVKKAADASSATLASIMPKAL